MEAVTTTSTVAHVASVVANANSIQLSTDDQKDDQEEDDPKESENLHGDDIGDLEDEFKNDHAKLHKKGQHKKGLQKEGQHNDGSGFGGDDEDVGMSLKKRKIDDATTEGM